ncbi:GerAB/ArcD/ProY family transporter [Paenibacillus rhizoplanae]
MLPETPIQAVEIVFLCSHSLWAYSSGLKRLPELQSFFISIYYVFYYPYRLIFLLPQMKLVDNLSPVLENGINPVLSASYRLLGIPFAELILLLMITPHITNRKKIRKSMLLGVLGGGIVLVIINVLSIAVLGADATAGLSYPTYELAKEISIGNFIQRIEVLAGGIIFISLFVKSIIVFLCNDCNSNAYLPC